jgi:hypothetical protein
LNTLNPFRIPQAKQPAGHINHQTFFTVEIQPIYSPWSWLNPAYRSPEAPSSDKFISHHHRTRFGRFTGPEKLKRRISQSAAVVNKYASVFDIFQYNQPVSALYFY